MRKLLLLLFASNSMRHIRAVCHFSQAAASNPKTTVSRQAIREGFAKFLTRLAWLALAALLARDVPPALSIPRATPLGARQTLADLPAMAQAAISSTIGRDQAAYHAAPHANGSFEMMNHAHASRLSVRFSADTVTVRAGDLRWDLQLRAWGYGDPLERVERVAPSATANRVEYLRGELTEWYVNGPQGLEQGFTIHAPNFQSPASILTLAFSLDSDLDAHVDSAGRTLTLKSHGKETVLRYAGLTAFDATGKELRAWLEVSRGGAPPPLQIHVDVAHARYPITVDPWIQQAKLTSSDWTTGDYFGQSVAINGDTVVVGAYGDESNQGAAYVFVKPAGGWSNMVQTAKLTASDGQAGVDFGASVAISGNTVVVGAWFANASFNNQGAAYVFERPMGGWVTMTQTAKLTTGADGFMYDNFGVSVAISGDTIVVGAPGYNATNVDQGAAFVFAKPPGGWVTTSTPAARLTASDGAASDRLGMSVGISGDTIIAGASGDDSSKGSAYVFVKPTGGWATTSAFSAKLTASDGAANDYFGRSVAISGDTIAIGAPYQNSRKGAAYVFVKPSGGWSNMSQTAKLTPSSDDPYPADQFGYSVSISGGTVVVGLYLNTPAIAYAFVKPAAGWTNMTETSKLIPSDGTTYGHSVAISGDTSVVGGGHPAGSQDNVYVFTLSNVPADLAITKTDDKTSIAPGASNTYTITVTNNGPNPATGALVTDNFPSPFTSITWTCAASSGSSCGSAIGYGNINTAVNLAVGGTATLVVTGTVSSSAACLLSNTATVSAAVDADDPNLSNNSATDTDVVTGGFCLRLPWVLR